MDIKDGPETARHFAHKATPDGSCPTTSGGESATHARCVALAVATLQDTFGDQLARLGAEEPVDVSTSGSRHQTRRADALAEFNESNAYYGNGLIIEV